jgi:cytochrome P450
MNEATPPPDWSADPSKFDLARVDPRFLENPFPTYARLRAESPVHRNPDGTYFVTCYHEVAEVLRSKEMSSDKKAQMTARFGIDAPITEHNLNVMVFVDPPDHTRIRKLVAHAFTNRALARWERVVEEVVDRLLAEALADGEMDLIQDFAYLLPLTVIGDMMGVPTEDRERFKHWSTMVTASLEPSAGQNIVAEANAAVEDFKSYLGALAEERRKRPGDDLMSLLVQAEEEGETLSELELLHNAAFLLNAGHETTSNQIGNGIHALFAFPEQHALLRDRPDLAASAVEEMLRYDSPNQIGGRQPITDTTFRDTTVPACTFVWISNGSANRDPAMFPEPDRFDIQRTPNKHVAFGHGIHLCLGAALARLEGRVAIRRLVCDYPKLRAAGPPVRRQRARHRGFNQYPVAV